MSSPSLSQAVLNWKTWFGISIPTAKSCIKGYNTFLILLCSSFPHNRRSSRPIESKTKTQTAAREVRSCVMEETQEGHCTVIMRSLCVCVYMLMCACVLYIIAPLSVVIAWPKVSAHYHLNSFMAGFICRVHTQGTDTHMTAHRLTYTVPLTAGWKCLTVKCMQNEFENVMPLHQWVK